MAIGAIWQPPIDQQAYDGVKDQVFQAAEDAGMRFHAAGASADGWRIIEVWDSREGLERFISETLRPAVEASGAGAGADPAAFTPEVFDVHYQGP